VVGEGCIGWVLGVIPKVVARATCQCGNRYLRTSENAYALSSTTQGIIKFSVPDSRMSCVLPASIQLRQTNFLACSKASAFHNSFCVTFYLNCTNL
jgi:hypothetical protein